jgi:hypothetical protein
VICLDTEELSETQIRRVGNRFPEAPDEMTVPEEEIDPSQKAHFISPVGNTHIWKPGMETRDVVQIAIVGHHELTALCGYKWVPTGLPTKHDTCEPCMEIAQRWIGEDGH